jgi:osmoprotectant transport system permease protein
MTALRSIPSLAVLALMLPVLGLGSKPALVALTLLAIPPILINTDVGYRSVDRAAVEAAVGMGMLPGQVLRRVETPLAAPVILAGVRTAAVEVIASATLAAFIGGGGLGDLIIAGLQNDDVGELLAGALCVALLALVAEGVLGLTQRQLAAPALARA